MGKINLLCNQLLAVCKKHSNVRSMAIQSLEDTLEKFDTMTNAGKIKGMQKKSKQVETTASTRKEKETKSSNEDSRKPKMESTVDRQSAINGRGDHRERQQIDEGTHHPSRYVLWIEIQSLQSVVFSSLNRFFVVKIDLFLVFLLVV
jgi:hypothetical protein